MLKQLHVIVIALGMLTIISTVPVAVHATAGFEGAGKDLGRALDKGIATFQQGNNDGEEVGEDDYPSFSPNCPGDDISAYCAGWLVGYNRGWDTSKENAEEQ